ncbi:MAG: tRNA (guanosine(37)-N1)-methyltransferase TrmD [Acholeplasmatales bacterium]|jgi:tRNA (guanine37-N1)-methyltransferase|nr:tRNA (guanosine(37)-N1)-methyltransferase TrmD [Acholeplasmatales bacterium]
MIIDIVTIFPELFEILRDHSIIKRAILSKKLELNIHNLRDYSLEKHGKVDDTIYGGGSGMLLEFPPLYEAIKDLGGFTILTSPKGKLLNQEMSLYLSEKEHITIICGHYEGVDARILEFIDSEISIGDYVLTGGEIPAMVIIDSVTRCLKGVIKETSLKTDSLYNNLLKQNEYTKPYDYKGFKVPEVLVSGNHEQIEKFNKEDSLNETKKKRIDLWEKYNKK